MANHRFLFWKHSAGAKPLTARFPAVWAWILVVPCAGAILLVMDVTVGLPVLMVLGAAAVLWHWGGRGDKRRTADGVGRHPAKDGQGMSREEARRILTVGALASPDEIRQAHRRLMHVHHPDRGGSVERAARLNQARDVLLRR